MDSRETERAWHGSLALRMSERVCEGREAAPLLESAGNMNSTTLMVPAFG
jgi:hypothetical protein